MKNIIETAKDDKNFSTLIKAIETANLQNYLSEKGPYTVFAPNNDAFNKIPKKDLENLLKNKKELSDVLKYHVVSGKVKAKDVSKLKKTKSLLGQDLNIKIKDDKVWINDSNVVKTDIETSNGIIHVIDSPLIPKKSGR